MANNTLKLRKLRGINDLSNRDFQIWRNKQMREGKLDKWSTVKDMDRLYRNQQFIKNYGEDAFHSMNVSQRDAFEVQQLKRYNDSLINKNYVDTWSPLRSDGTVDPNKGMGNWETFYKYGFMEPQFKKELAESSWLTDPELNNKINKEEKKNMDFYTNPLVAGTESGAAGAYSYFWWGRKADDRVSRGKNQNIIDGIYAKDMAFKAKKVSSMVDEVQQNILNSKSETQIKGDFIKMINSKDIGIPLLAAYYDEKGNIKSDEVSKLDSNDMARWLAKSSVYSNQYAPVTAVDMLDKEAKDYIHEHQDWIEYSQALANSMAIGAAAYGASMLNGVRGAFLSVDNEKVPVWRDKEGHFWGKEYVNNGVYKDPYTSEEIPVTLTTATKSALDMQGIAPDGTTRGLVFNNKYWSDAESTETWSREEQARAKELNGYSPTKAVYKYGEDKDYLWEVAKMAQFAAADALISGIPVGGLVGTVGKGVSLLGKALPAIRGVSQVANGLKSSGAWLVKNAPNIHRSTFGTLGAIGIGHSYGTGKFYETLEGNMLKIEDNLYNEAEERFHELYNSDSDEGAIFRNQIDNEVNNIVLNELSKYGDQINYLSEEDRTNLINSIKQQAQREVAQNYTFSNAEAMKNNPEYSKQVDKAIEEATNAAIITSWTVGAKYVLVNNFGYRKFLFKPREQNLNSSIKKAFNGITPLKNGKLSYTGRLTNGSKKVKWGEVGKITTNQFVQGALTNFTDELQAAGAGQVSEDRMAMYLNDDYESAAEAELLGKMGFLGGVLSYATGAGDAISKESTWDAGLVGGLGSLTSAVPNAKSIAKLATSKKDRKQWEEASMGEKANMLFTNGILNTYYDRVLSEKQINNVVQQVNAILDKYEDFRVLGRGLALDMASIDATNPEDKNAIEYVKAVQIAHALSEFNNSEEDGTFLEVAKKSSVFQDALETIDKITNDKFTDEDAKEYLTEYYVRNPSEMKSEENNAAALETIKSNAQKLKTGIEVYNKVNEVINKIKRKGRIVSPLVKARLIERFALDQFLGDRIAEVEENISGNREVTTGTIIESFGNNTALKARIRDLINADEKISAKIDKAKNKKNEADKKLKDYLESKKDAETEEYLLTSDEEKELAKLQAQADAAAMQVRALEDSRKKIAIEKDTLLELKRSKPKRKILSSNEILRLPPEDRARMLDDINFKDYSKAQQIEIAKAKSTLNLKDPELLDAIQNQSVMVQMRAANSSAYSMMIENPEAAAAQLDSEYISRTYKRSEAANRRNVEIVDSLIKALEEAPGFRRKTFEDILYNQLINIGNKLDIESLKNLRNSNSDRIQRYSHIFDKVINKLQFQSDVKRAIDGLQGVNNTQKRGLTESVNRMINKVNTRQDLLDELGTAIESTEVAQTDKDLLEKLLYVLEETWNQQSSTVTLTKEQKQQIVNDLNKRVEEETARVTEAEEAAKKSVSPDITDSDTDTSNDKVAAREAVGVSEKDTDKSRNEGEREAAETAAAGIVEKDKESFTFTETPSKGRTRTYNIVEKDRRTDKDGFTHVTFKGTVIDSENPRETKSFDNGSIPLDVDSDLIDWSHYASIGRTDLYEETTLWAMPEFFQSHTGFFGLEREFVQRTTEDGTVIYVGEGGQLAGLLGLFKVAKRSGVIKSDLNLKQRSEGTVGIPIRNYRKIAAELKAKGIITPRQLAEIRARVKFSPSLESIKDAKEKVRDLVTNALTGKVEPLSITELIYTPDGEVFAKVRQLSETIKLTEDPFKQQSNDRVAELAAQGLTEKDVTTNNESTLTPEQIAKAVEEGVDVDLESPTLEEQTSSHLDKIEIRSVPKNDSTDQGNAQTTTLDEYVGNTFYEYDIDQLKYHGKQVRRKGKSADDIMSKVFNWLESAGIKLQDIIDIELSDILKSNPDVYLMLTDMRPNATNDKDVSKTLFLTVEYNQEVQNIHNDELGGVITSNGKQYLIIGIMGSQRGNTVQKNEVFEIMKDMQIKRKRAFDSNPSERFFVDRDKHTKVVGLTAGRLVRQLTTDSEVKIRTISELLSDKARNPKGLTMGDLKWYIRQGDKIATVNVSDRNIIYPDTDGLGNKGATFLLIEAANGNYIPAYIRPTRFLELKDGKLKTLIDNLFKELASTKLSERKIARDKLRTLLVLKEKESDINCGTEENPKVSVIQNGFIKTFDLSNPNVNIFGQNGLLETLRNTDFRVNITIDTLSDITSLEMFDEAGALTTDLAKLGTSGASYNVYSMDANGNPIITTPVENKAPAIEAGSDLIKAQKKKNSETINNTIYRKDTDGNWRTDTDELVTDPRLVEQLNYKNLIRARDLKPNKVRGIDEIFIVNSDINNPLVLIRRRGNQIFPMSKEGAIKTINEVNAELIERTRQEKIQKELETEASNDEELKNMSEEEKKKIANEGEDVDLGLDETITEEQLVDQITGNFETEAAPQQNIAEELVGKITSDTADIHLSEDGTTYVDAEGKHYARVTSVIAADEFSDGRFEANNPWGLPSTTIGTGIDEFVRDFFDNKLGNLENLADRYPNASNEQLQAFAKQLEGLRDNFKRRGLTIVPRDVTVTGTVEIKTKNGDKKVLDVAGTLDLLAYDKDGNFYIFDMKTNRSVPKGEFGRKKGAKWSKQLSLYKQLLQEKYGAVVKGLEIIPIQVDYPAPKGWGNATTEYSNIDNQLYADGEEYRRAEPILHDNIPLPETTISIDYSKLTPTEQAMVRSIETDNNIRSETSTKPESKKTSEQKMKAKEKLARVEFALNSSDVQLWSDNSWDNITITVTHNGFHKPTKKSRLWSSTLDYSEAISSGSKVGDTLKDGSKIIYRDRHGNTYVEVLNAEDGKVKSAVVVPTESGGNDNFTVHFYKTLTQDERATIISYIQENRSKKEGDLINGLNYLLQHTNNNLLYLRYKDPNKLTKLKEEAYTEPDQAIVEPEPIKTNEDINKTGTKSLAELQSRKTHNTALSIIRSVEFGARARKLLKAKFPDMPSNMADIEKFLQSKEITTTGIPNVEDWLKMIEECK